MNLLENKILTQKLSMLVPQLENRDVFEERGINTEEKKTTFAFVVYTLEMFLKNFDISEIMDYITDGSGDCSFDICHIDTDRPDGGISLNIFQAKYKHEQNLNQTIGTNDISSFLNYVKKIFIHGDISSVTMNQYVKRIYEEFIDIVKTYSSSDVHINLFFATNGADLNDEDKNALERFKQDNSVIETYKIIHSADFYLSNINTVKDTIDLQFFGDSISTNQELTAYVVNIRAKELVDLYQKYKDSILDKNVRRLLAGSINQNIEDSLLLQPKMFWYKNNGLSIVAKRVEKKEIAGNKYLVLEEPYIVNGGQTTKTLYNLYNKLNDEEEKNKFYDALVLTRVYQTTEEDKVKAIVYGTNNQNKITSFDLKSGNKNLRLLRQYFENQGVSLVIQRDVEEELLPESINSELLLQVYCAIYKEIPHRSKISKSKLTEDFYDIVYDDTTIATELFAAYKLYDFTKKENKKHTEEHLLHSIYAMLFVMTKKYPELKRAFAGDVANKAYEWALNFLTDLTEYQKSINESYTHHNFFKSELSKKVIEEALLSNSNGNKEIN